MGYSNTHLLRKIDRIRAKGDQRRADRIEDARLNKYRVYQSTTQKRVHTPEQIALAKSQIKIKMQREKKIYRIKWIIAVLLILGIPIALIVLNL